MKVVIKNEDLVLIVLIGCKHELRVIDLVNIVKECEVTKFVLFIDEDEIIEGVVK